jgi:hypothetical protein
MVYLPEFQRWQSGANADAPPRTARADILAPRQAAGQGRFDVTGVAIDVSASLHATLVAQFEQAGFQRDDVPQGTRLRGDGWTLTLRTVDQSPGLTAIDLDTRLPGTSGLTLGSARMTRLGANRVRLQFGSATRD